VHEERTYRSFIVVVLGSLRACSEFGALRSGYFAQLRISEPTTVSVDVGASDDDTFTRKIGGGDRRFE